MKNDLWKYALLASAFFAICAGLPILSPPSSDLLGLTVRSAFALDPGCTNGDCPPDPGCTNGDCPPDPGCTNGDCPPPPGCTNGDCPPYYADCCCYQDFNPNTPAIERICCCKEGLSVSCRVSEVISLVEHITLGQTFATLQEVAGYGQDLCAPDSLFAFLGIAREPLGDNQVCGWIAGLRKCVAIDIKPGSDPNCININGHGLIPVAINGSSDLDVFQVDLSTLNFSGLTVRVKGNGAPQCSYDDWNGDSYADLICQFEDDPTAWLPGNAVAVLTGKLMDGTPIKGIDSICVKP